MINNNLIKSTIIHLLTKLIPLFIVLLNLDFKLKLYIDSDAKYAHVK